MVLSPIAATLWYAHIAVDIELKGPVRYYYTIFRNVRKFNKNPLS